jgi:hypothetical protein
MLAFGAVDLSNNPSSEELSGAGITIKQGDPRIKSGVTYDNLTSEEKSKLDDYHQKQATPTPTPQQKADGGFISSLESAAKSAGDAIKKAVNAPGVTQEDPKKQSFLKTEHAKGGEVCHACGGPVHKKMYAGGGDIADAVVPDYSSPDSIPEARPAKIDPKVQAYRDEYNKQIIGPNTPIESVDPNSPAGKMVFLPGGQEPSELDPRASDIAKQQVDSRDQMAAQQQADQDLKAKADQEEMNRAKQMMGMATPAMQAPSPADQNAPQNDTDDNSGGKKGTNNTPPQQTPAPPQAQTINEKPITYTGKKSQYMSQLDQEDQAWQHDLADGHIKPETYQSLFAKENTLGKIGTLFGMLVSGIGTGHPNAVMAMMNQEIANDLDAQKQSKVNAQNYLKLNQSGVATQAQAYSLAKMQMNAAALHSLALQTAALNNTKPGSLEAQRATQMLAMMNQSVQNDNYNLKDRAAAAGAYYDMVLGKDNQGTNAESPAIQIRKKQLVGAITPQQSEAALKEVGQIQNHVQMNKNALDSFDTVSKLSTLASKMNNPVQNQKRVDAEWDPMMDKLTKDTEGRVTPITVDMMSSLKPQLTDNKETIKLKRSKLLGILNGGFATPTLDSIGVNVNKGEQQPQTSSIPDGATGTLKDGTKVIRQNGKWVPK